MMKVGERETIQNFQSLVKMQGIRMKILITITSDVILGKRFVHRFVLTDDFNNYYLQLHINYDIYTSDRHDPNLVTRYTP